MLSRRKMNSLVAAGCAAARELRAQASPLSREEVVSRLMTPYEGPSEEPAGALGLEGKVFCGYQGWFTAPGDGSGKTWFHYGKRGVFEPGTCHIDLWPDVSGLDEEEKYPTAFRHRDGSAAHVFSSMNRKTVLRHFRWMREHRIDGAFVQRFTEQVRNAQNLNHATTVLGHCREGANRYGLSYAVMYDTPFDAASLATVKADWQLLVDRMRITSDGAYLRHRGRPVVALWGYAFTHRHWDPDAAAALLRFLREDKRYGNLAVMLGIPTGWRTLDRDCLPDSRAQELLDHAAILSPWTVGRYRSSETLKRHSAERWQPDADWCARSGKLYLPVVFPGFSWHNLKPEAPLDQIPRRKGEFLWNQFAELARVGARSCYVAMFDEMDEGTAIFPCSNDPPVGKSPFLTYEGLPASYYLALTGRGRELLSARCQPCGAGSQPAAVS